MMANGSKYDTNAWSLFKAVIGREERKKKYAMEEERSLENSMIDVTLTNLTSDSESDDSFSPHSPIPAMFDF